MNNLKSYTIATIGIFVAIILLLAFSPIGYINTFGLSIQLITIPVGVGACIYGAKFGALLGLVFGLTSFSKAFGFEPFGSYLFSINPILTFIMCVIPRILSGFLPGLVKEKFRFNPTLKCYFIPFLTAFFNTLFFMLALVLFFWNTEYIQSFNSDGKNVFLFVVTFVGINGLIEWVFGTIVGGTLCKAIYTINKNL